MEGVRVLAFYCNFRVLAGPDSSSGSTLSRKTFFPILRGSVPIRMEAEPMTPARGGGEA